MASKTFNNVKLKVTHRDLSKDTSRSVLVSGENISHSLGKIARWYKDISWVGHTHSSFDSSVNKGAENQPVYILNGVPTAIAYTIKSSVPENAVFTDTNTKVTSVGNHYTPSGGTTTSASGGSLTDITNSTNGVQVVTGVTKDAAGHVTGVTSIALKSVNSNTTYAAGTGISMGSGNVINHANSITAVTTAVFKKFTYDAQGHITGTAAVAAADLPAHTHSEYAAASHTHDYTNPLARKNLTTSDAASDSKTDIANSGLSMNEYYNNTGGPAGVSFGNIINVKGTQATGAGQLFLQWHGDDNTGDIYYRSHRDMTTAKWGAWKKVAWDGHTHSQYYDSSISRTANTVLAAPNGSAGAATFRALVAADIPSLAASKITSGTFDAARLPSSGATAGSYGPSANASPAHSGTFSVPYLTVDSYGRVTAISTKTITLPASGNTDAKVTQTISTANAEHRILMSATADDTTRTEGAIKDAGFRFNPSTNRLILQGSTVTNPVYGSTGPAVRFLNSNNEQGVELVYSDYDTYFAPASLTLSGLSSNGDVNRVAFISPRLVSFDQKNNKTTGDIYISTTGTAATADAASTQGEAVIRIGNEIAAGAKGTTDGAGNSRGRLRLYGTGAYYADIIPGAITANRSITIPNASGTISLDGHTHSQYYDSSTSRTANTVLAAPNGSAGAATFRKLVAADIPALNYLPRAIYTTAQNADNLNTTGWFDLKVSNNTNIPTTTNGLLISEMDVGTKFQLWFPDNANTIYKRYYNNSSSVWNNWVELKLTDTVYTHPSHTAASSGLYKITVDSLGHVTGATAVVKADITALGIPGSDTNTNTTYSFATGDNSGSFKVTPSGGSASNIQIAGIKHIAGDSNGHGIIVQNGGLTMVGAGESATALQSALGLGGGTENLYLASDNNIYLYTNCQTIANRKYMMINTSAQLEGGSGGSWIAARASATVKNISGTGADDNAYHPVISCYTNAGEWSVGTLGAKQGNHESLYISYTTNANYTAGTNTASYYRFDTDGTYSGKAATAGVADSAKEVSTTVTDPSSQTTYGVIFAVNPDTSQVNTLRKSNNFRLNHRIGAANTEGLTEIVLGNNVAKTSPNNTSGHITLYNENGYWLGIKPGANTANITVTLPTSTGSMTNIVYKTAKTATSVTNTGWANNTTDDNIVPTMSFMAYWNGRYSSSASNLQYCDRGRFGTIITAGSGDYLAISGGTMTGDITFTGVTSTTYPASSKAIKFSGSTDGANIFYRVKASDQGELVIQTTDDSNCIIRMENSHADAKNIIKFDPYNSYIYANYFNAGCGAETPTTSSYIIYANSDGWFRKSTLANVKTILGLGSAAYTASTAYAASSHTHSYAKSESVNGPAYSVAGTAGTTEEYRHVWFSVAAGSGSDRRAYADNFKYEPALDTLKFGAWYPVDITGQTVDLNSYTDGSGKRGYRRYICKTTGGGTNISNKPSDSPFALEVILIRFGTATTDFITKQIYHSYNKKVYQRFCVNNTWDAWTEIKTTDTVYTHPSHTAASSGLYKITVNSLGHVTATTAVAKADITALGIPGTDTNTTYSAGTGLALSGTTFYTTIPRVAKDSKAFPGANKVIFEEYTSGNDYNLPSNAWYHIISMQGSDVKYGTQLALGMTANNKMYFRNYNNSSWSNWNEVSIAHSHPYVNTTNATATNQIQINPTSNSSNSYNEGLRIGKASNNWSNINFGCSNSATSGTQDGQWLVGARGAAGSKSGAVGDFTIENNGSTGTGLTLYKNGNTPTWNGTAFSMSGHTHSYLPLSGGTMTGAVTVNGIKPTTLATDANLNSVSDGFWMSGTDGTAQSISNSPSSKGWAMWSTTLYSSSSDIRKVQIAIDRGSNIYVRGVSGTAGAFDAWKTVSLSGHTHSYLPLSGGTLTGGLTLATNQYADNGNFGINCKNSDIININVLRFGDLSDSADEGIQFYRDGTKLDVIWAKNGVMYFTPNHTQGSSSSDTNYTVYHSGNLTLSTLGGAASSHTHSYLPLAGGTMSGTISSSVNTSTYLNGNKGTNAIINSTSSAGAYVMLVKMNSTNGYFTHGTYQTRYELHYTAKSTVDAGTNAVTKNATLLDESGNASWPGTITASSFSGNATSATTATTANRLKWGFINPENSDASSKPWFRIAYATGTGTYTDFEITLLVSNYYGAGGQGILKLRARTEGTAGQFGGSRSIVWTVMSGFTLANFKLITKNNYENNTAKTGAATVELWVKNETRYNGLNFVVLTEGYRSGYANLWKFTGEAGVASIPTTGKSTEQDSTLLSIANRAAYSDKGKTAVTDPSSHTSYGILFVADPNTSEDNTLCKSNDFRLNHFRGAANTEGISEIVLGNNVAKTAANNSTGYITFYNANGNYVGLIPGANTANITVALPSSGGTLALAPATLFSGTAASSVTLSASVTGFTSLKIFCKNSAASEYFVVTIQAKVDHHLVPGSSGQPAYSAAAAGPDLFGMRFVVDDKKVTVSCSKKASINSSNSLANPLTIHILKVLGLHF